MTDFHSKGFDDATKVKLDIFRGYIREWLSVFMTQPKYASEDFKANLSIFDFFSGPGYDSNKNPGSPIIITDEISSYCRTREDFKAKVHVDLFFNDSNHNHIKCLEQNISKVACNKPCCNYHYSSKPFIEAFQDCLPVLKDSNSAKLVIMDQFGVKQVTPDILKFLATCKKTDVLFFISSSFIRRFIETPEIGSKFNLDTASVKNIDYNAIHRLICSHFRDEIKSEDYFLAPFSLKKGPNIYGIIFGSSSLYGLEKFLQVCWKIDEQTGEANYNKGSKMKKTKIEWTETTWNPITGCSKHSAGCLNCYAERIAKRLQAMGAAAYKHGFTPVFHEHLLEKPLTWKKSRMTFVNSMSDTFHEDITDEQILELFSVMNRARWHTFQVLTKRSDRLLKLSSKIKWTPNIWQGVTVEHTETRSRIEDLRLVGAQTKFLSIEPLIGPITGLNLTGIDWVIVGGESGPGARPMKKEWVTAIRDICIKTKTPFFFKQWGGVRKKENGRMLEDRIWDEMPLHVNDSQE